MRDIRVTVMGHTVFAPIVGELLNLLIARVAGRRLHRLQNLRHCAGRALWGDRLRCLLNLYRDTEV